MIKRTDLKKLSDYTIWQQAKELANEVSGIYRTLSVDEQAMMKWSFYIKSFDLTNDIASLCGSIVERDSEVSASYARRGLFVIINSYKFMDTEGIIKLDPSLMVKMMNLDKRLNVEIRQIWHSLDGAEKMGEIPR